MKKLGAVFSALLLTASITACGTTDVNDINNRRVYDVNDMNDRRIYDVNDRNGVYDVNDYHNNYNDNLYDVNDRNIYNYPMKNSPLRNDPEANGTNNLLGTDRDDTFFNDERLNMDRTYNNR